MEFINNRNNHRSDLHLDNQIASVTLLSDCNIQFLLFSKKIIVFCLNSKVGLVLVFLFHNVHFLSG